LSSDPHQVALDGSPAVHQTAHFGQEGLAIVSSLGDLSIIFAETLPLGGTYDLPVEPLARVCDTTELGDQLMLIHLVQTRHRATEPRGTGSLAARRGSKASGGLAFEGKGHVGPEDQ
jgi:hypothetical protein